MIHSHNNTRGLFSVLAASRVEAEARAQEEADENGFRLVAILDVSAPSVLDVTFIDGTSEWLVSAVEEFEASEAQRLGR